MPRIRFIADPKLPRDIAHLGYRKDTEVEVSDDEADRWLRRNVAEVIASRPATRKPKAAETLRRALGPDDILHGSSVQPSSIEIGGKSVQLGTVVAAAYQRSAMSVTEWNDAEPAKREALIEAEIEAMRAAAAQA